MSKRKLILAVLPILALLGAAGGFAYWTTFGSGSAAASVGSLTAPGQPSVPITSGTVNLSWTAGTVSGGGTVLYHVERRDEPGSTWTDVCGSSDAAPIAGLSCSDMPGSGTFVYRVTSRYASWHTTGAESDPVLGDAPPYVISINRDDGNPTNATTLNWTVTFSESVTGVDATDFVLAASGVAGATISGFTGSGSAYTVTADSVAGEGTLGLNLDDDDSILDSASNPLGSSLGGVNGDFTGQVYTVDQTVPSVTINQAAGQADPTNGSPINFTVVFSESTANFVTGDVTLAGAAGATTATVTGSGTTYNVAASGMTAQGAIIASIGAGAASDAAGNGNTASTSTDNTVTYDTAAPTVLVNQEAGQADPANTVPILYTVTFSEPVTGFDATDLTRTGSSTGGNVAVTGTGAIYEIAVTGTPTNGTIVFTIAANKALDLAGNNNTASTSTDNSVTYDTVAPTVALTAPANNSLTNTATPALSGAAGNATGDSATVTVTIYNGTGTGGTVAQTIPVTRSGAAWSTTAATLADGLYTAQATQTDTAGNTGTSSANSFTVDTIAPTVTLTAPVAGSATNDTTPALNGAAGNATGDSATVTVRIYIGIGTGGSVAQTIPVTRSGATWSTTAATLAQGTYTAQATQTDNAGNTGTTTANTFTVDSIAPTVTLTAPTNGSSIANTTPTLSGAAGNLTGDAATVTVTIYNGTGTGGSVAQMIPVTRSGATWTTTAATLAQGTYTAQATQTDTPGNTGTSSANTFTVDTTAPSLTTLEMFDTDFDGKINEVKATFDETLAACTAPCTTGWTLANVPSGGTLSSVSVLGSVATLTITEGVGAANTAVGTFTIALAANAVGIRDEAGNQSSFAATAPADKARPVPTTLVDTNGTNDGKFEATDTMTITFSEAVTGVAASSNVALISGNGGNSDTLTMSSFLSGTATLPKPATDYISGNNNTANFTASALSQPLANQVRITLSTCTGACAQITAASAVGSFTYTPVTTITDIAGNPATGSITASIRVF